MKTLEDYLRPTQEGLFKRLQKMFAENAIWKPGCFLLVPGESPALLIAHLDTVHQEQVKAICASEGGNILMSPQGIGGDDRCGVYGIVKVYEASEIKPWLLFTCDEEIGARGARAFCESFRVGLLPKELDNLKMLIELDRKGKNDAVYYGCENPEFEAYITEKGFQTKYGSFSDISILAPELEVAAVNLSCGYYHPHTTCEYINRRQLKAVIKKVVGMVSDAAKPDFPKYEYMEAYWRFGGYGGYYGFPYDYSEEYKKGLTGAEIPKDVPGEEQEVYEELLDLYDPVELGDYWKKYGIKGIRNLYRYEYGAG